MFPLKTIEEMKDAIRMIQQDVCLSQSIKASHQLEYTFMQQSNRISYLEDQVAYLQAELSLVPEYQEKKRMEILKNMLEVYGIGTHA